MMTRNERLMRRLIVISNGGSLLISYGPRTSCGAGDLVAAFQGARPIGNSGPQSAAEGEAMPAKSSVARILGANFLAAVLVLAQVTNSRSATSAADQHLTQSIR